MECKLLSDSLLVLRRASDFLNDSLAGASFSFSQPHLFLMYLSGQTSGYEPNGFLYRCGVRLGVVYEKMG